MVLVLLWCWRERRMAGLRIRLRLKAVSALIRRLAGRPVWCYLVIGIALPGLRLHRRRRKVLAMLRRRRRISVSLSLHLARPSTLQGYILGFDQSILDRLNDLVWEDWSGIHRAWHRLLPGLDNGFHVPPSGLIDESVRAHEGTV